MRLSIITPSYNSGDYIDCAIQSVLQQKIEDWEHIIVDGGSTDNTLDILKSYKHLIWVSEPDKGQSHAMNKGFQMSTGDIIVYLNADDYFLPKAFESAIAPFEDKNILFVYGEIELHLLDGSKAINAPTMTFETAMQYWKPNPFSLNPVGYFYRREVQEVICGFNETNHYAMDLEFLLEVLRQYPVHRIETALGVSRQLESAKTRQTSDILSNIEKTDFVERFLQYASKDFRIHWQEGRREHRTFELQNALLAELKNKNLKKSRLLFQQLLVNGKLGSNARFMAYLSYLVARRIALKITR